MSTKSPIFATQGAKTMFAALYGEFDPRPGFPDRLSEDAYSLFFARSAALGWLSDARGGSSAGSWGMNEAEVFVGSGPPPQRVAFFQVVLIEPAPERLLPVQPFLACAAEVVARLGHLRLAAVQLLLPARDPPQDGMRGSMTGARVSEPLITALNWFGNSDSPVPVRVTLDGGPDPSIRRAALGLVQWVNQIRQRVFVIDSLSLEEGHLELRPPPLDGPEGGFAHQLITLSGTLAEWSLDCLGWVAAFLADGSARNGVRGPLILNADRRGG